MTRSETAFHTPMLSNWGNYPQWLEKRSIELPAKANKVWKQLLGDYEPPLLDSGIAEAVADYVVRRRAEGGTPMNWGGLGDQGLLPGPIARAC